MKATLVSKTGLTDKPEYALDEGKSYLVGRSREADVIVKDKLASRNHCKIAVTGAEEWSVADLGSSNGTYVNRQRITTRTLRHGDILQVGKAAVEFRLLSATTAPTVATPKVPPSAAPAPPPRTPPPLPPAGGSAPKAPPAAPPRPPRPQQPSAPPGPPAPPPAAAKPKEGVDEDIRGLFDFLDKVGKGGQPPAADDEPLPVLPVDEEAPPKLRDEKTPALKLEKDGEEGALFSLLDKVEGRAPAPPKPGPPGPPPLAPPPPAQSDQGGLLAFLRKKKQQP